ncbi:FAD-dependent thymidylate synthase [Calderihabitans maritimus]|uniref:Flavin-dependent thymidylate synthase n=1 Tax=Calderihabitans maritimus TaxID=1246530 RepID=A0A1Z5HNM7_9FIRM|nr:FAD-dependent thymidylate synthase [Calderihabitans maritimus]GAW91132.1 thymidylate synthase, flavin-dependent [Calderihabitans maritimus]
MGRRELRVELLRYTHEPEEIVAMGAKLCYSAATIEELKEGIQQNDQREFIRKLMNMEHLSPVEHASFTFGIEGVSRSLLAQITRHRIASFSVKSQRYVKEDSSRNVDGTFGYIIPPRIEALGPEYVQEFERQMKTIQKWYDFWVEKLEEAGEAAHEDARFVLPNAAETKIMVTMNGRELLHFFRLRCCNRAQWEIRRLAEEMLKKVKAVAPNIFENAGPACLMGPCPEGPMSCGRAEEVRRKFKD